MGNETSDNAVTNVYIAVESVIGIMAILGNTLVIWAVKVNTALQDTTFYFIVSLALADLAVGALVMPLAIILSLDIQFHFYTCLFLCCLIIILTNSSIMSLLAIAVDRYLRIKIPTRYRTVITKKRTYLYIFFSWSLSFLGAMVPMFGWNKSNLGDDFMGCSFPHVMSFDYLVYFCFFGWVLVPLLIMVALYSEIFYLIKKHMRQNTSNFQGNGTFYGKEYKTATSLALVMAFFALCWLPISIVNCITYFYPSVVQSSAFQPTVFLTIVLSHLNSAINPVVYALRIRKFKHTFLNIIRKQMFCRLQVVESSSVENTIEKMVNE